MPDGIHVEFEGVDIPAALAAEAEAIADAFSFSQSLIRSAILYEIIPGVVSELAVRAGRGFPSSYRNHLILTMQRLPLSIVAEPGYASVSIDLQPLGGFEEFTLAYHQGAMLEESDVDEEKGFSSFRITTRGNLVKQRGPWEGGDSDAGLLNAYSSSHEYHGDRERRIEWWNQAIIGRNTHTNVGKNWAWVRDQSEANAWEVPKDEVPTFEQVASDRVNDVWLPYGVAPEWILLEYGSGTSGGLPIVRPVGFVGPLDRVIGCAVFKIWDAAVSAAVDLLSQSNVTGFKKASGGRYVPYNQLGQFTEYKPTLQLHTPDIGECLSLI